MNVSFLPEISAIHYAFLNYVGIGCDLSSVRFYIKNLKPMTNQAFYAMSKRLVSEGFLLKEGGTCDCRVEVTELGEQVCDDYQTHAQEALG